MRDAKVALDSVFAKVGLAPSDELPKANAEAFKAWLSAEIGQLVP